MKKDTHIVLIRRYVTDDESPRWELVNFATSQRAADELAKRPMSVDGESIAVSPGDLLAAGPMEIANPMVIHTAKLFVVGLGGTMEAPPPPKTSTSWLELWEGADADAAVMVKSPRRHDVRRLAFAACAVVRTCLHLVGDKEASVALSMIEATERVAQDAILTGKYRLKAQQDEANRAWYKSADEIGRIAITAACNASDILLSERISSQSSEAKLAILFSSGVFEMAEGVSQQEMFHRFADVIRRFMPLPTVLCANMTPSRPSGIPILRSNPFRRGRR